MTDTFLPQNARLILYFHVGTGKCVVWSTSAEFYGFGKSVQREQKGPLPPASDVFVMMQVPLYLLISLPAPLNPSEQRAPTVMHIQRYCTPSTDTWDTSDVGYSIYRRHWLDRMHLITWVFVTPGWVYMLRWESVQELRADLREN